MCWQLMANKLFISFRGMEDNTNMLRYALFSLVNLSVRKSQASRHFQMKSF
jgi:hypothetical protein